MAKVRASLGRGPGGRKISEPPKCERGFWVDADSSHPESPAELPGVIWSHPELPGVTKDRNHVGHPDAPKTTPSWNPRWSHLEANIDC